MSENLTDEGKSLLDDAVEAASAVPEALLETAAAAAAELADLELDEVTEKVAAGAKKAHKKSKVLVMTLLLAGAAIGGYLAWSKSQKSEEAESGDVDSASGSESSAQESASESETPAAEESSDETS